MSTLNKSLLCHTIFRCHLQEFQVEIRRSSSCLDQSVGIVEQVKSVNFTQNLVLDCWHHQCQIRWGIVNSVKALKARVQFEPFVRCTIF